MSKWGSITTAVLVVCLLTWIALGLKQPREPVWQGKSLSAWLGVCYLAQCMAHVSEEDQDEAVKAVTQIGTNAIPFLLKWMAVEDSPLKTRILKHSSALVTVSARLRLDGEFSDWADRSTKLPIKALIGFSLLGSEAKEAVPELIGIMRTSRNRRSREDAATSLAWIGPCGVGVIAALIEGFKDPDQGVRNAAVRALLGISLAPAEGRIRPSCAQSLKAALRELLPDSKADADAMLRGKVFLEKERQSAKGHRAAGSYVPPGKLNVFSGSVSKAAAMPRDHYDFGTDGSVVLVVPSDVP